MDAGDPNQWHCESCGVPSPETSLVCQTCQKPKITALGSHFTIQKMKLVESLNSSTSSVISKHEKSVQDPATQGWSPLMDDLRRVAGLQPTGEIWECPKCTLLNASEFSECEVCEYINEPLVKIRGALQKECKTRMRGNVFIRGKNWIMGGLERIRLHFK